MSGQVTLVYGDALMKHHLSDEHPLQPIRVKLAVDLIKSTGLIEHCDLLPPRAATIEELELVHSPEYVELVQQLSDPLARHLVPFEAIEAAGYASADNPISDELHEGTALVAGATVVAAERIESGAALHAFSPSGGLHHAHRDRASGFCTYNDAAIACEWFKRRGHRVAYVDVDVHHGDGVEHIFQSDPEVLTISLHESGRWLFPGTGFPEDSGVGPGKGFAANLPFVPYTWDEPWLAAFEEVVPALLRRFKPTVLVTQDGCDTHHRDPLAHLAATTRIWPRIGALFHELAHELCEGRWLALGGGGYAIYEVVPRAWTLFFAEMVERPDLTEQVNDPHTMVPEVEAQERVWTALRKDLRKLGEVHGLNLLNKSLPR
ncbi:MAG TPA: acetoin utilization protein AcuC [Candidatus Limnocylindrales bacterium]|nr:acetoin utilization protein AcuC [Candidatus Limnocylindrales bacterium]